jgi:hypothetical protein
MASQLKNLHLVGAQGFQTKASKLVNVALQIKTLINVYLPFFLQISIKGHMVYMPVPRIMHLVSRHK